MSAEHRGGRGHALLGARRSWLGVGLAGGCVVGLVCVVAAVVAFTPLLGVARPANPFQPGAPTAAPTAPSPTATPDPVLVARRSLDQDPTRQAIWAQVPPRTDQYALFESYGRACGQPLDRLITLPSENAQIGDKRQFWNTDSPSGRPAQIAATLRHVRDHTYLYVEDGVDVDEAQIRVVGDDFEDRIYPTVKRFFGDEWPPELADDRHITILTARLSPRVAGFYFGANDLFSRALRPQSNERRMIYISAQALQRRGPEFFKGVIAHEFGHMVQRNAKPAHAAWVNEGLSEMANKLVGADLSAREQSFMTASALQLNGWEDEPLDRARAHYGSGYLFLSYFGEQNGGYELLRELGQGDGHGLQMFANYLKRHHSPRTVDDFVADWQVANYVNDPQVEAGRFAYRSVQAKRPADEFQASYPAQGQADVRHYAPRYVEFLPDRAGTLDLRVKGAEQTRVIGADPLNRYLWWSAPGDDVTSSLMREFDLTGVPQATLNLTLWYDIDRGYVVPAVSEDGGCTWKALRGQNTRSLGPLAPGGPSVSGYQNQSGAEGGPRWVDEKLDLSAYAGKKVLFRLQHVNSIYLERAGFALGKASLPEIGFNDDLDSDNGWQSDGFLRLVNRMPEKWLIQVIQYGRDGSVTVTPLAPDPSQAATFSVPGFGERIERVVLVYSAAAPGTVEKVPFDYQASVR